MPIDPNLLTFDEQALLCAVINTQPRYSGPSADPDSLRHFALPYAVGALTDKINRETGLGRACGDLVLVLTKLTQPPVTIKPLRPGALAEPEAAIATPDRDDAISEAILDAMWKELRRQYPIEPEGEAYDHLDDAFMEAAHNLIGAWRRRNETARIDDTFVAQLPEIHGWTATWEHPGFMCWRHPKSEWEILSAPDYHHDGKVALDRQDHEGEDEPWEEPDLEWPLEGRTVAGFVALITPVLRRWQPKRFVLRLDVAGFSEEQVAMLQEKLIGQCDATADHPLAIVADVSVEVPS